MLVPNGISKWLIREFLAPEGSGGGTNGGGSGEGNKPSEKPDDKPKGKDDSDQTGGKGDSDSSKTEEKKEDERRFTQKDLDEIAAKVRREEKTKLERKEAETKGEYQKLYTDEKAKREALETEVKQVEVLSGWLNTVIDGEISDWPEEVKKTDPGKQDVAIRKTWVENHRDLSKRLKALEVPPEGEHGKRGNGEKKPDSAKDFISRRYALPGKK